MKAIPVIPGKANSVHLTELPMPNLVDVPEGRGVLVKVLQVGQVAILCQGRDPIRNSARSRR